MLTRIKRAIGVLGGKESLIDRENRCFGAYDPLGSVVTRTPDQYLNAYTNIAYIGQGASKIADYISRLQWKTVRKNSNRAQEVADITTLFQNLNGLSVDYNTMVTMMTLHYILDGNIFLMLDYRSAWAKLHGIPDSVIPIAPNMVTIYDANGNMIDSTTKHGVCGIGRYQVIYGGRMFDLQKEDMIHVINAGPFNCLRGIGLIQQNIIKLDADRYRDSYNQATFKNGGRLNSYLTHKGDRPMGKVQVEETRALIKEQIQGHSNAGQIPLIPANFELASIDLNFKDMEILEQNKMSREDIMAILSIPAIAFGIMSDVRYDSAKEQLRAFYEICIPRYTVPIELAFTRIVERLDSKLKFQYTMPKFYDEKTASNAFDRGVITRNDYREIMGFERVGNELDDYYITMNLIPAEMAGETQSQTIPAPDTEQKPKPEQEAEQETETDDTPEGKKNIGVKITRREQLRIHRRAIKTRLRIEKNIQSLVSKYYKEMIDRCASSVDSGKAIKAEITIDDVFDSEKEKKESIALAKRFHQSGIALGINDTNEIWDLNIDGSSQNPDIVMSVDKLSKRFADQTVETRRDEVKLCIDDWQKTGDSLSVLKRSIQDIAGLYGDQAWKSQRIARTEASHAYHNASMIGYDEIGVKLFDMIGCMDSVGDCNRRGMTRAQAENPDVHPNHTGTTVPAI